MPLMRSLNRGDSMARSSGDFHPSSYLPPVFVSQMVTGSAAALRTVTV